VDKENLMGPVLLCDDGSADAASAVVAAARLLEPRDAVALHVWQLPSAAMGTMAGFQVIALPPEVDEQAATAAERLAQQAADRAGQAGFDARPLAVRAVGPAWQVILEVGRQHDAAVIVVGARGLTGLKHVLLGSVSEKVARHADRPVLILHPTTGDTELEPEQS